MLKFIMIPFVLFFMIMSLQPTQARTWKQGAIRYIHYTGGCSTKPVIASFYGAESGRKTASGQRFNPNGHTAAHRTLPFGTRLHVTNPHNQRSIQVVINDRGPFVKGVTLDLSRGAARAIGMNGSQYICVAGL